VDYSLQRKFFHQEKHRSSLICKAQGGFREPEFALYKEDIKAEKSGIVTEIDNRRLAKIAKLAGAPHDSKAGGYLKHL
jgi:thymidine phosphorylase